MGHGELARVGKSWSAWDVLTGSASWYSVRDHERTEGSVQQEASVKRVSAKEEQARKTIREIRRATRRKFSAEEKIRIVLEGLRGDETVSELCRREGIAPTAYCKWSKSFLEAGKQRLAGETKRDVRLRKTWHTSVLRLRYTFGFLPESRCAR
jgi:transposase